MKLLPLIIRGLAVALLIIIAVMGFLLLLPEPVFVPFESPYGGQQ